MNACRRKEYSQNHFCSYHQLNENLSNIAQRNNTCNVKGLLSVVYLQTVGSRIL